MNPEAQKKLIEMFEGALKEYVKEIDPKLGDDNEHLKLLVEFRTFVYQQMLWHDDYGWLSYFEECKRLVAKLDLRIKAATL